MYIILKADENTSDIQITNRGTNAHYLYANTLSEAKAYLDELEDTDNFEYWSKYYAHPKLTCCKEFNDFLQKTILDTNHLSYKEIFDLCQEYISWLPDNKKPSKMLNIKISINNSSSFDFGNYREQLFKIIDKYTQTKHNICRTEKDFNPIKDLGLLLPLRNFGYLLTGAGALNSNFYKFIYYFDYLRIPIENQRLRDFWYFYKKTMNVYGMGISILSETQIVVNPKPDEIFIKDGITHCIYDNEYYCNGIKVPDWLYKSKKEDLDIKMYSEISNADIKAIFVKKIGLEKFIKKGKVIDTWKNYPDNEWWAKSEYQLIDMKNILVKEVVKNNWSGKNRRIIRYDYAPYLCMKNQTTGEYHMEGVSPDCRNLYDALKMRYQILDLPSYEIKNIK